MSILELRDVSVHFGGLPAVDGVDLDVRRGGVTALIGPNGSGKSTLLHTVAGLHRPDRGRVVVDGTDVTGMRPHEIRRRGVALVVQTPRPLPSMTVRDNVALGAMFGTPGGRRGERAARAAADDVLDVVGLGPLASSRVEVLTLHQRRGLELARALAGEPTLLLLDEVMAGLTPAELGASMALVRGVVDGTGTTVVLVEHVVRAVRELAEHVVVVDHGRLLARGDPATVMRDEAVVEAYLGTTTTGDGDPPVGGIGGAGDGPRPGGGT